MSPESIAANRFGLGSRPGERLGDPRAWLLAQVDRDRGSASGRRPSTEASAKLVADYLVERRESRRQGRGADDAAEAKDAKKMVSKAFRRQMRRRYENEVDLRLQAAVKSDAPFIDRLTFFWSNHFAVSGKKPNVTAFAGSYEAEAIRPYVTGRFADMLRSAEQHPAMLIYLDQLKSTGPDSPASARNRKKKPIGLNENLAREIMELHTLGVRTGYTQADVTEFARALTGWSSAGLAGRSGAGTPGQFRFDADRHQPGARVIVGRTYPAGGAEQGERVLADLAASPATARHIATKLTRHFAGAPEPPAMVDRLATAFHASGGDLPTVYRALVASPEAWVERPVRFRTPWEWAIAVRRATAASTEHDDDAAGLFVQLGQPVWQPLQPAGWDDDDATWAVAEGLMRRVEEAERLSVRIATPVDARRLSEQLFPGGVSPATAQALTRAESPAQQLALLFCSPEMMRR